MLKSIALIMLIGMSTGWVCRKVKLPGLLGMLFTGIILGALIFRMAGVALCMAGTKLKLKERVFCMLAYTPKATVQAAIGGVPLSMGLACGNTVLTVAVLAIIITAPLGAFAIDMTYRKLLKKS
ncbi:hypothetical protein [Bacteroides galacturonicus]|jgi:sodium/proton antiporter, CPA1 family (TC 2.A.36)|nr:hypothetical protein C7390_2162 [Bacteroides galacturonicus]